MLSDLTFSQTRTKHTLPTMNIVCWSTGLQRVIPLRDQSGETLRNAYRNNWLRSYGRPRILVVDQQRSLCSGSFAEKVDNDGTRLEVTPLEASWRNGKTERAGKDWKENCYKSNKGTGGMERSVVLFKQRIHLFACTHPSVSNAFDWNDRLIVDPCCGHA